MPLLHPQHFHRQVTRDYRRRRVLGLSALAVAIGMMTMLFTSLIN